MLNKPGRMFIISAPAGTGKTTLAQLLIASYPKIIQSISYTTRKPRTNEKEGVQYHFISVEAFKDKIALGEFLEYAQNFGDYYGTLRTSVEKKLALGHHILLVIDTEGARQIRAKMATCSIFILPPSMEELERRLRSRGTEGEEMIQKRVARAQKEIAAMNEYDYALVNDAIEPSVQILKSIVIAEEHKIGRDSR